MMGRLPLGGPFDALTLAHGKPGAAPGRVKAPSEPASRVVLACGVTPFKTVVRATTICADISVRQKMSDPKIRDLGRAA
jgi:hypothetical protein